VTSPAHACKPTPSPPPSLALPPPLSSPPHSYSPHTVPYMGANGRRFKGAGQGSGGEKGAQTVTSPAARASPRACKSSPAPPLPISHPLSPSHPPPHVKCTYSANRSQWQTIGGILGRWVGGEGRLFDFPVASALEFENQFGFIPNSNYTRTDGRFQPNVPTQPTATLQRTCSRCRLRALCSHPSCLSLNLGFVLPSLLSHLAADQQPVPIEGFVLAAADAVAASQVCGAKKEGIAFCPALPCLAAQANSRQQLSRQRQHAIVGQSVCCCPWQAHSPPWLPHAACHDCLALL